MLLRTLALLTATLPALMAHDGHHHADTVVAHVLTQPDHLLALGAGLALALGTALLVIRRRRAVRVEA